MANKSGYEDIDMLVDPDDVVVVISRRKSNGRLALAFMKQFERDGDKDRSAFLAPNQLNAVRRLLPLAEARLAELVEQGVGTLPPEPRS